MDRQPAQRHIMPGNQAAACGDLRGVRCERWRDAISARADGEDPGVDERSLTAHLTTCAGCRSFAASAGSPPEAVDGGGGEPPASLATTVARMAAIADRATTSSVVRGLLAVVAVEIIVMSTRALVLGDQHETSTHAARHLGAFTAAYGVGLLVVVARPARARTLLPVAAVVAGALVISAIVDLVQRRIPVLDEAAHLPEVVSVVLVWLIAVPASRHHRRLRLVAPGDR
jgi:predicted anti-sigma-YlaC factor YlaD